MADIHFSPQRAIEALEAGAAKIRLNPGNIKDPLDIRRIIDCAKQHSAAIRIGVNEASIRDLKTSDVQQDQRVALMLSEMQSVHLKRRLTYRPGYAADTVRTIEVNAYCRGV